MKKKETSTAKKTISKDNVNAQKKKDISPEFNIASLINMDDDYISEDYLDIEVDMPDDETEKEMNDIESAFGSKDDYIKTLEMSVNILQNDLRDAIKRIAELEEETNLVIENDLSSTPNTIGKTNTISVNTNELLDFSELDKIEDVFDLLYKFLAKTWEIIELDLFILDSNKNFRKIPNINSSVSLENVYLDLEGRGILDWAASSNEIKMLPNSDENLEAIKSIVIIPISMLNKNCGFFLANTPLSPDEIDISKSSNIQYNFQVAFSTISIINSSKEKENSLLEYKILREQILLASNQIASSEIVVTLNNAFELPLKVIKTNIELLQKGVGDTKRRLEIISEQFVNLADTSNLMKEFGNYIEYIPYKHNLLDVVNQSLNILSSYISKNGIVLKTNFDDKTFMIKDEVVMGYRGQLIFALLNIMLHSISTMPDGGSIHIGLYKNENAIRSNSTKNINTPSTISIIISDNGTGVDCPDVEGELISLADLSEKKMKTKFLFLLSQHIISQHKGKFSIYSESGKGTTFKITIPVE